MDYGSHLLGTVTITISVPPGHELCDPPPEHGIEVRCTVDEPMHADPEALKRWAHEKLLSEVDQEGDALVQAYSTLAREIDAFPWDRVFRPGMRIRGRDGAFVGEVISVDDVGADSPSYMLLVDGEGDIALEGGGMMAPWHAIPLDDEDEVP